MPKENGKFCKDCKVETKDISPQRNNGIYGPGFQSWKIIDLRVCPKCRVVYHPEK